MSTKRHSLLVCSRRSPTCQVGSYHTLPAPGSLSSILCLLVLRIVPSDNLTCCDFSLACVAVASRKVARPSAKLAAPRHAAAAGRRNRRFSAQHQTADYLYPRDATARRRQSRDSAAGSAPFLANGERRGGAAFRQRVGKGMKHSGQWSGKGEVVVTCLHQNRPRRQSPYYPLRALVASGPSYYCSAHSYQCRPQHPLPGKDRSIGYNADVLLGFWSCCRNIDPDSAGCVTATRHTRALLQCAQCGTFYNHMDNVHSKLAGVANCKFHPKEPVASRSTGTASTKHDAYRRAPQSSCSPPH